MKKSTLHLASLVLLCFSVACGPIIVRVGSRDKPRPEYEPQKTRESPDDLESWFVDYAEVQEDQARILVRKVQEGLRQQVRSALHGAQDAVEQPIEFAIEPEDLPEKFEQLAEQHPLEVQLESSLGPWHAFLEAQSLLFPKSDWPAAASTKQVVDDFIVALFFDFGVSVRGHSFLKDLPDRQVKANEIFWQIVPERQDIVPDTLQSLRMRLIEDFDQSDKNSPNLQLEFLLGPGLYEGNPREDLPYSSVVFQWEHTPLDEKKQQDRLSIWQGQRNAYSADLGFQQGLVLTLRYDTSFWLDAGKGSVLMDLLVENYQAGDDFAKKDRYLLLANEGWQLLDDESLLDLTP